MPRASLALCLLFSVPVVARADWPVSRGPSREPQPFRYDPAALKQLPREFLEDSVACVLYYGTTHLVEADGTVETVIHEVTRLNARKGVEKLGEYRNIVFDPGTQKLTLNEARVLKPDGRAIPLEPRHAHLRDQATDYQVYDSEKLLVLSFPNLEVGDVIEVKWTTRGKTPEYEGHFFARYSFGYDQYPVVRDEFRLRLPRDLPLRHATAGARLTPAVHDEGEHRWYHWRVADRSPLPRDADLPPREALRATLMVSTFPSWEEIGLWKERLRATCWDCTPAVRKVVAEVTRGLRTPQEKARALTHWVRQRVRYVSVTGARRAYVPQTPAQVVANLYGDCKDQSQLLAVMLREVGLRARLVTLGVEGDGQIFADVPSPWGTHAILLLTIDGKEHWIDTTATHAPWDGLPPESRDRVAYVTDGARLELMRTPPLPAAENRYEQHTRVWLRPDTTTISQRSYTYHGQAAVYRRSSWSEVPPGERRRQVAAWLLDSNSRSRLRSLSVDEAALADVERPVSAVAEFEVTNHFSGTDREGSFTDSHIWDRLLAYTLDPDRKAPLDLARPFESVHRYELRLPPAYRFSYTPLARDVSSKWGRFRITVKTFADDPRRVEFTFHTRIERGRVEPADFDAYRKFHDEVQRHWRAWVGVAPTREPEDAAALEAWLFWAPGDRESAAVLANLYMQEGKPADARRVVQRALAIRPRDTALWELRLKAAGVGADEIAVCTTLMKLFPDEPKHALALGEAKFKAGDLKGARAVLEPLAAKGKGPARGGAHYRLARLALQADQPAVALKHLAEAAHFEGEGATSPAAIKLKGRAHELLKQTDDAVDAYRTVLRREGESEEVLAALVRVQLAAGRRDAALTDLRRYTVYVGEDVAGQVQAASWHLELGRYEDAFELASRAQAKRFDAGAQRVLGLVQLQRGNHEKAVFHLDRAHRDADVISGLLRGYLALGRLREAGDEARAAEKLKPAPPDLVKLCAIITAMVEVRQAHLAELRVAPEKSHGWASAIDAYLTADLQYRRSAPRQQVEGLLAGAFPVGVEFGPAYALRGLLALERGRLGAALLDAERAIALTPNEARAYLVRGRVRLERVDRDALQDLTRAAELSGRKDAKVLHWLAAAQFQVGRRAEALTTQREALKLRPEDPELVEQMRQFGGG